ncbi:cytochrome c oxidase subunit 4 [Streptomyces sp. DSM 15324]|uniref:aa3-type cytochrome oxidase subunit IV n=1 Tax=Streptomyces sp. DSM 15324 TaxID=1739111 RepID=UPI00074796DB|nr:cytochrome c oxidase subunit 4 [Streptomyces sp. DSM 15324]KUO08230.1 hypothetical protein AQJ58_29870 [Streptomyces sp. DSM 15324]
MKAEAMLFGGVAVFFGGAAMFYGFWSHWDPAGTAALVVAFCMGALVSFYCSVQYVRHGARAQDRTDAEVADRVGPLDFFPPHSGWPVVTALGFALAATGVVFGLWLFLIGFGILARGVLGMVFQYVHRGEREG